jgi:hypothetical protein
MICMKHKAFPESILLLSTAVTVQVKPYEVQAITGIITFNLPYKIYVPRP